MSILVCHVGEGRIEAKSPKGRPIGIRRARVRAGLGRVLEDVGALVAVRAAPVLSRPKANAEMVQGRSKATPAKLDWLLAIQPLPSP